MSPLSPLSSFALLTMPSVELIGLNKQIRNARERLKRSQRRSETDRLPSAALGLSALMVYSFSWNNLDVAARFLLWKQCRDVEDLEKMRGLMERIYRSTPNSEIVQLMNEECVACYRMRQMTGACRFIVEFHLCGWVEIQNCEKGFAPNRAQLVREALSFVATLAAPKEVQDSVRQPLLSSVRSQRKWMARFRKTWGAKLGKLQVLSPLPLHVLQEKARVEAAGCAVKGLVECRVE